MAIHYSYYVEFEKAFFTLYHVRRVSRSQRVSLTNRQVLSHISGDDIFPSLPVVTFVFSSL